MKAVAEDPKYLEAVPFASAVLPILEAGTYQGNLTDPDQLAYEIVYPTLLVALLLTSATFAHYFTTFSEKRYLKRAFQHYVPPAVVESLVADADRLQLGGEKRELTVLFSDIRGFTTLSEAMGPEGRAAARRAATS